MAFCQNCGTNMGDGSFCPNCGKPAYPAAPSYPSQASGNYNMPGGQYSFAPEVPVKKNKTWLFVLLGVLAIAAAAAVLGLLFFHRSSDGAGTYTLASMEMNGETIDASTLESFGMEIVMVLREDGTGEMAMYGDEMSLTWDEKTITVDGDAAGYVLDGDTLTVYDEDAGSLIFIHSGDVSDYAPPAFAASETNAPYGTEIDPGLLAFWNRSWYGWWLVDSGSGDYADWDDGTYWWDACADFTLDEYGNLNMTLWDEDYTRYNPMAEVSLTLDSTLGSYGSASSTGGYFWDAEILEGDWEIGFAPDYEDLIIIKGYYTDPANEANNFNYSIYLRPWGTLWDDLAAEDSSFLPYYYESWYLPLIESGVTTAPDEFETD